MRRNVVPIEDFTRLEEIISEGDNVAMWKESFDRNLLRRTFRQHPRTSRDFDGRKPHGIWYSCGLDWIDWVRVEMPDWLSPHVYKLDIDKRTMLLVQTERDLLNFDRRYGFSPPGGGRFSQMIDWEAVADEYDGIEICPYRHESHLSLSWYYTWDVASGCVWNPDIILEVTEVTL